MQERAIVEGDGTDAPTTGAMAPLIKSRRAKRFEKAGDLVIRPQEEESPLAEQLLDFLHALRQRTALGRHAHFRCRLRERHNLEAR